jgi:hypothetical protein
MERDEAAKGREGETMIDHRQLLVKYIRNVASFNGLSYLEAISSRSDFASPNGGNN